MLEGCFNFFDKVFTAIAIGEIKDKIEDVRNKRNVKCKIEECSKYAGEILADYFRNEKIDESQVNSVMYEVQRAIDTAEIDARFLVESSFSEEKLVDKILEKYTISEDLKRERLENIFRMTLLISAEQLCQIALIFKDWEKEAWRKNFEGLDRLEKGQQKILKKLSDRQKDSSENKQKNIYISEILRKQVKIEFYSLRMSVINSLDLVKVFVEPDIIEIPKLDNNEDDLTSADIELISLEEARKKISDREEEKNRKSAKKEIEKHQRCAIIGVPGSGKSTLLKHIFWSTANESKNTIPVLLKVRELDLDNLPGVDEIIKVAEDNPILSDRLKGFLDRELDKGTVLLLIDGLDEVIPEKKDKLIKWISQIVNQYPDSKYIISSRPSGYRSEIFQELNFKEFQLCDFTLEQVKEFVYKWTKAIETAENNSPEAIEQKSQETAKELVNKAESNSYILKIATNPLMLSTLCVVQKYEGGNLPNRRVVLYQRCVEGLLFYWDKQRKIQAEIIGSLSLERKLLLLRRLAIEMQNEGIAEIEASKVEISFQKSLEEVGDRTDVKQILANIRDRSGLLVERRPEIYAFSHLNFQEYLAALSINEGDFKKFDRLFLFSQRSNSQWKEVIVLYAGIAPKDSVEMLLEELLNTKKISGILLSGECLTAAENVKLDLQKKVIDELLFLESDESDESELSRILFIIAIMSQIPNILSCLDRNIVKKRVIQTLDNLESNHALRFIVLHPDYCYIEPLLQTGIRILTRKQEINFLAAYIAPILLHIEYKDAANALGKLAEIAEQEDCLENNVKIFESFWFIFGLSIFPIRNYLLKILNLTNNTSATTIATTNLCKFIALSSSEKVLDSVLLDLEKHYSDFSITDITNFKWLLDRIIKLRDRSDGELKKYATEAANNLEKSISKLEIEIETCRENRRSKS